MAIIPKVNCGYFKAPKSLSSFSELVTSGNLENHKILAHNINKANKIKAGTFTASMLLSAAAGALMFPNKA